MVKKNLTLHVQYMPNNFNFRFLTATNMPPYLLPPYPPAPYPPYVNPRGLEVVSISVCDSAQRLYDFNILCLHLCYACRCHEHCEL